MGEVEAAALDEVDAVGEVAGGVGGAAADGDVDGGHAAHERIVVDGEDVLHVGLAEEDDPALEPQHLRDLVHGLRLARGFDHDVGHCTPGGLGDRGGDVLGGGVHGVGRAQGAGPSPGGRRAGR